MKVRSVIPMRIAKISVVLLSLGILFIILPDISMRTIGKMLGAVMVLFGCIKLTGYFSKDLFRLAFQYDLQFGILVLVVGLIVLLKPSDAISLLFAAMGIALIPESSALKNGGEFSAIVTILLGATLITEGILNLFVAVNGKNHKTSIP